MLKKERKWNQIKWLIKRQKKSGRKMDEHRETFNKELGDIKKNQGELRNTIT